MLTTPEPGNIIRSQALARTQWIDLMRGIAVLLVIVDHSALTLVHRIGYTPPAIELFNNAATPFRMATLMFLSGMLLPRSLSKPRCLYIKGKMTKIAWPYFLWSLIILGTYNLGYLLQGKETLDALFFFRIFYSPPTLLWYLAYLLLFYMLVTPLSPMVRSFLIPVIFGVSALLPDDYWTLEALPYLFGFFLLGDLAARTQAWWEPLTHKRLFFILSACITLLTSVASVLGITVRYQAMWAPAVVCGISVAIPMARALVHTRTGLFFAKQGRESIVYYVTHSVVLLVVSELLLSAGVRNPWVIVLFILLLALLAGCMAARLRRKFRVVAGLFEFPENISRFLSTK